MLRDVREKKNLSVFAMPFYSRLLALSSLDSFVYVCADYVSAGEAYMQISSIRDDAVLISDKPDPLTHAKKSRDNRRLAALYELASGRAKVAVVSVMGLSAPYPDRETFLNAAVEIVAGKSYDISELASRLTAAGYVRRESVADKGEFAVRGSVLDIMPINGEQGIRVDFFDDEAEKILLMDFDEQRRAGEVASFTVCPAAEIFFDEDKTREAALSAVPNKCGGEVRARLETAALSLTQRDEWVYPLVAHSDFYKFCGVDYAIFDEAKRCVDNFRAHETEFDARLKSLLARGDAFAFEAELFNRNALSNCGGAAFDKTFCQNRIFSPQKVYKFQTKELPSYARDQKALVADIKNWQHNGIRVAICCTGRLKDGVERLLGENGIPFGAASSVRIYEIPLYRGGCFFDQNTVIIGSGDISARKKSSSVKKKAAFFQPKVGDYIVHESHGVGVCEGLKRMTMGGVSRDYVVIRYDGGDILYVPAENMDSLTAYAGAEQPRLNKLGGADFAKVKDKVKKSIKAMAFDLSKLYAEREIAKGFRYNPDREAMDEFYAAFPYEETSCQITATEDGIKDLTEGRIMDRLLCGDVGYGKTEVAMRLMYKVILDGKQAAFVSPTTILARQHCESLKKRLGEFGVSVGSLTRFDDKKQQAATIAALKKGSLDIVCGTHRVLSKDVEFADLGLMVLDEEQRFGVADKEKIKLMKREVNVLSLSATPIPRTLHLSLSGIRDISILDEPPSERIPVSTFVCEYSDDIVRDAVNREIARGGQVFIVYNRVEKIDSFAAGIAAMFPDRTVRIAHGQMPESALENAIDDFITGKTDILVASTIIENGIDMPNANTMIVVEADKLGLSQLYQLRGRIGRSNRLAYAFFTYEGSKPLSETALKRLDAINSYTDFGSGFKLALRDLEIRGAGNVLGREQHGHMQKVGYELYLKLIGEVMDEIKGIETETRKEVAVSMDFPAYLPEEYVSDIGARLKEYKRIAAVETPEEARSVLASLSEGYGTPPQPAVNLLYVALVKNLASSVGAVKAVLKRDKSEIIFERVKDIGAELLGKAGEHGLIFSAQKGSLVLPGEQNLKKMIKFLLSAVKR